MDRSGFDAWLQDNGPLLHRKAFVLTGDWALAQDLVQHASLVCWTRFATIQDPNAYATRVMVRTATTWWRRRWRGELPGGHARDLPDDPQDPWPDVRQREELRGALQSLPTRQRAVLLLRFVDDLSEAQTAEVLGCPVGSVKSATHRALATLRTHDLLSEADAL